MWQCKRFVKKNCIDYCATYSNNYAHACFEIELNFQGVTCKTSCRTGPRKHEPFDVRVRWFNVVCVTIIQRFIRFDSYYRRSQSPWLSDRNGMLGQRLSLCSSCPLSSGSPAQIWRHRRPLLVTLHLGLALQQQRPAPPSTHISLDVRCNVNWMMARKPVSCICSYAC